MAGNTRPVRGTRHDDIPAEGTVEVRLRGRPEDVKRAAALIQLILVARHSPDYPYGDRNGVTVRRYMLADLRVWREMPYANDE